MRRLDNSVMKPDTDPDVFLSEINQVRDELGVLDETVSTERLTTIILDALPAEMYLKSKTSSDTRPRFEFRKDSTDSENDLHQSFGKVISDEKESRVQ